MNIAIGTVLLVLAFLMIYSGFKGTSPREEFLEAFQS